MDRSLKPETSRKKLFLERMSKETFCASGELEKGAENTQIGLEEGLRLINLLENRISQSLHLQSPSFSAPEKPQVFGGNPNQKKQAQPTSPEYKPALEDKDVLRALQSLGKKLKEKNKKNSKDPRFEWAPIPEVSAKPKEIKDVRASSGILQKS